MTIVDPILSICCLYVKGWTAASVIFLKFDLSTQPPLERYASVSLVTRGRKSRPPNGGPGRMLGAIAKAKSPSV